jgi:hypothetical protein
VIRDRYKAVTSKESFVILVPASLENAAGEGNFLPELYGPQPVRVVTLPELKKEGLKLRDSAGAMFFALLALRDALESRDDLALEDSKARLERAYLLRKSEYSVRYPDVGKRRRVFASQLASPVRISSMSVEESLQYIEGLRPGPQAKTDLHRLISYEVSCSVRLANAGLWWWRGAFRPAIYCLDIETALYFHTFFIAPTGKIGFRICPYCTDQFFQQRPNQDYCRVAHREAHRVARWRNKKKTVTGEETIKRRHDGAHKAR